jgi:uncharacterized membrane protein
MTATRLERTIGRVLRVGVVASSIGLGLGLGLSWLGAPDASSPLFQIGVIILLATPIARVLVSIVEYVNQRDWPFVVVTGIVLLELMASVVAALLFNRKL